MSVVRRIDSLGRIVIPSEFRNQLGIKSNDSISIELTNRKLIIEKVAIEFKPTDFIRRFIVQYYGNRYQDLLITKTMVQEVLEMLQDYFDKALN